MQVISRTTKGMQEVLATSRCCSLQRSSVKDVPKSNDRPRSIHPIRYCYTRALGLGEPTSRHCSCRWMQERGAANQSGCMQNKTKPVLHIIVCLISVCRRFFLQMKEVPEPSKLLSRRCRWPYQESQPVQTSCTPQAPTLILYT